jgi:hypothetical protein
VIENQNTINYFFLIVKCRCRCNGKIPHLMEVLYIKNRGEGNTPPFTYPPNRKSKLIYSKPIIGTT